MRHVVRQLVFRQARWPGFPLARFNVESTASSVSDVLAPLRAPLARFNVESTASSLSEVL